MLTSLRLNPDLLKVPRYTAGRSIAEVQEHYGLTDVVKMASNENALGASPLAVEAARQALAEAHLYPGTADRDLRRRIAQSVGQGLDERHVILGNGATDLIRMLAQAFVFGGGEMLTASVTFPPCSSASSPTRTFISSATSFVLAATLSAADFAFAANSPDLA